MEAYLLKASAILALFLIVYQTFLKNETFFRGNRYFLLGGIGAALLLPLVTIREEVAIPLQALGQAPSPAPAWQEPAGVAWDTLLLGGYLLGAGVLLFGLLRQLVKLRHLIKQGSKRRQNGLVLVRSQRIAAPFSFFRYVFYNPQAHDPSELAQILEHEKAHARQWHSLDVLLGRATAILLWANPLAWWYQKSLQQNLEYLADAQAACQVPSVKAYQYTLLKVSGNTPAPVLANSFYQSPIKKRIAMLHQNPSKTIHLLKYLVILPALAGFLMAFNTETVYVPEEGTATAHTLSAEKTIEVTIDKGTTDAELAKLKRELAEDGIDFSYTTVRNEAGEIVNLSFNINGKAENGNPFSGNYNSDSEEPIKPVIIYINSEGGIFFGEASTYREFKTGKEVHFSTGSGDKMIWVQRSGEEEEEGFEFQNTGGKHVFIVNSEENAQRIEVREKDGQKIIIVDGKEVSREDFGKEGRAQRIFVKMLETDEDPEVEVEIKEIRVREDGDTEQIIEIRPEGDEKARYKTIVVEADKNVDISNEDAKFVFYRSGKGEKPLIFIDGKKANQKKMNKLDPDQIESINVLKGDKAVEKYGKKAENGAIEITTKKQ